MKRFKEWMGASSSVEKTKLANEAGTSTGQLYQLASGERFASAFLAGALEGAFKKLFPGAGITRGDLNEACAKCPYFKQCMKGKK